MQESFLTGLLGALFHPTYEVVEQMAVAGREQARTVLAAASGPNAVVREEMARMTSGTNKKRRANRR